MSAREDLFLRRDVLLVYASYADALARYYESSGRPQEAHAVRMKGLAYQAEIENCAHELAKLGFGEELR